MHVPISGALGVTGYDFPIGKLQQAFSTANQLFALTRGGSKAPYGITRATSRILFIVLGCRKRTVQLNCAIWIWDSKILRKKVLSSMPRSMCSLHTPAPRRLGEMSFGEFKARTQREQAEIITKWQNEGSGIEGLAKLTRLACLRRQFQRATALDVNPTRRIVKVLLIYLSSLQ